jgi:hypothetical protein
LKRVSARDPRLRPYRAAAWIAYFSVIAILGVLVVGSIARNLWSRPHHTASAGALPTRAALRVCLTDLELLFREENQRAWTLGTYLTSGDPVVAWLETQADPVASWLEWSRKWEERVDDLSDRCRLDESGSKEPWQNERSEMAAVRDAMRALHRAYRTQVTRFAQEQGDLARAAAEALSHARKAVEASR